ncbi:RNA polymerase sigma factor [Kutzneria chonburiensis]|uniref:RNA polymerase sigma factor n=1 Tax=Kutzneria chonburiensis TaxID=1483604 RepID=A0ABV6N2J5_9PSEU|nr:RNA polymerase sigma factor [Kutzneria chonburiensis]
MDRLGSESDLVALYDTHARLLFHYLSRRVGPEAADDLVAETFLAAWQQRATFDPARAGAKAWLYGIATNLMRRHLRGEERRLRAWGRAWSNWIGHRRSDDDLGERVATAADAEVLAGRAAEAVAQLRSEEREVLLLVAWASLTPTEVAEALGVAVATVRTRLHRARTNVRKHLEDSRDV